LLKKGKLQLLEKKPESGVRAVMPLDIEPDVKWRMSVDQSPKEKKLITKSLSAQEEAMALLISVSEELLRTRQQVDELEARLGNLEAERRVAPSNSPTTWEELDKFYPLRGIKCNRISMDSTSTAHSGENGSSTPKQK
jgi:hypothetical protein